MPNYPQYNLAGKYMGNVYTDLVLNNTVSGSLVRGDGNSLDSINVTASNALTASLLLGSVQSASYALSASYAPFIHPYQISSSWASSSISASYAPFTQTYQTTTLSSSWVSASVKITTADTASYITAANLPTHTASWASNTVSSTYSVSSSWVSASVIITTANTASYIAVGNLPAHTASWATTAVTANAISFVPTSALSSSWVSASVRITTADTASYITAANLPAYTASWANNVVSSSYALSASYAPGGSSVSSSYSTTSSYVLNAVSASYSTGSVIGNGINNIKYLSQSDYNAIGSPDPNTLYVISSSNVVGNVNTASYALTASYSLTSSVVTSHYETFYVDASAFKPSTWSGSAVGTFSPVTGSDIDVLDFDSTIPEYAQFKFIMPENWNKGTLKASFVWATTSPTVSSSMWEIAAGSINYGQSLTSPLFSLTQSVISANLGAYMLNSSSATPPITVSGSVSSNNTVFFQVNRKAAPSNNLLADASLFGVNIQYLTLTSNANSW
jgi:hypothetical protein